MSEATATATKQTAAPEPGSKNELKLQRGCDCGQHTPGGHECDDCKAKRTKPQRWPAGRRTSAAVRNSNEPEAATAPNDTKLGLDLSRVPARSTAPPAALLTEDTADEVHSGQLAKTEFLNRLETAIRAEAAAVLAGTGRSAIGCPYLDFWFTYYRGRGSDHVEKILRRYAPETATATTAAQYIPAVTARVRQGIERWAATGDISGIPEGPFNPGRVDVLPADDPTAVRAKLGRGRPLDSAVRDRMGSAFRQNFSHVRTHTDSVGGRLSSQLNAKAFTVGEHIAFGAGEYQPGTVVGDALIAHELAHVIQQGRTADNGPTKPAAHPGHAALEREADGAAVGAVVDLWSGANEGSADIAANIAPRAKAGLRLQRCSGQQTPQARNLPTAGCPPVLHDTSWDVAGPAAIPRFGCSILLARSATVNGMTFTGNFTAGTNCVGRVYFVQYTRPERKLVYCPGRTPEGLCQSHRWGVDTNWPYGGGDDYPVTGGETRRIQTHDSPGFYNVSDPEKRWIRIFINDEFVTYVVFEDPNARLTSLGWMHWQWNARAWRDQGTCSLTSMSNDCAGWTVTGTGTNLGENFTAGSMYPAVPLSSSDRSGPFVSAPAMPPRDCPASECPGPSSASAADAREAL